MAEIAREGLQNGAPVVHRVRGGDRGDHRLGRLHGNEARSSRNRILLDGTLAGHRRIGNFDERKRDGEFEVRLLLWVFNGHRLGKKIEVYRV